MEARAWVDIQLHPAHICRVTSRFRNQRIIAGRLIVRAGEQRIVEFPGSFTGHAARGETVEVIIGADGCQPNVAALGGRWVHVVKMAKVGGIFRFTERGESVAFIKGFGLHAKTECRKHQGSKNAYGHLYGKLLLSIPVAFQAMV
ncbi:hypothetical protein D3C80_1202300 [compost metagenome]